MTWLAGIAAIALLIGGGLWVAVWANGPAVLDAVDRLAGGRNSVALLETAHYGQSSAQKLRVYRADAPDPGRPLPVLVFAHGGGWAHGDPDDYGFIARNLAPEGYLVVLVGYRLGEDGRYPRMLEDTAAALAWVRANAARLGGDPDRLLLAGHSAGAYNVVASALDTRWLEAAGVPPGAIKGVVGLSGPYDFFPFVTDRSKLSFGSVGAGPDSQPVNHARSDAPPMLLVHGVADTTVRIRNTRALAAALGKAGAAVEVLELPGAEHNAPLLALTHPWRRDSLVFDRVRDFLARSAAVSVPVQAETP